MDANVGVDHKLVRKVVLVSLVALPGSCGSLYASQYFGGKMKVVEACALECGEERSGQSFEEGAAEFVFISIALAMILLWAWWVDRLLKKAA